MMPGWQPTLLCQHILETSGVASRPSTTRRTRRKVMRRLRGRFTALAVALLLIPLACPEALAQAAQPVEPRASGWKTWVLTSGAELRLPGPPDAAATQAELAEVRAVVALRDAAALERIRYWDAGSPAYRWNELMAEASVRANTTSTPGARAFALLSVATYDALVAAWDSKYAYDRRRPNEARPGAPDGRREPAEPRLPRGARRRRRCRLHSARLPVATGRGALSCPGRGGGTLARRGGRPVPE